MTTKVKHAKGISLACLTVSDFNKAKHLFVDLLGLDIKEIVPEYQWMELGVENDEARIGVGVYMETAYDEALRPGSNAIISIEVENLEHTKAYLESHGVEFLGEILEIPGEIKMILFKDTDQNRYFLTQNLKS